MDGYLGSVINRRAGKTTILASRHNIIPAPTMIPSSATPRKSVNAAVKKEHAIFALKKAIKSGNPKAVSLMKKIDIKHLDVIKKLIKKFKLQYRIRYRGQSTDTYKRNPSYALMNNATSFAIYER